MATLKKLDIIEKSFTIKFPIKLYNLSSIELIIILKMKFFLELHYLFLNCNLIYYN